MKDTPKVGLGVLVFNENHEVLLLLRNSDAILADSEMHLEGTWTLPAGKVKFGETLSEVIVRKVKEETNLDVLDARVICIQDDINQFAHYVTVGCIALKYERNICLGSLEHVDYKFFSLEELPSNLCEPSKKIIEKYLDGNIY